MFVNLINLAELVKKKSGGPRCVCFAAGRGKLAEA